MIRLFIALELEEKVKQYFDAIIQDFQTKGGSIKWVDPKNIHITLKFLGNTEKKIVPSISEQLEKAASSFSTINTNFTKLGGFPNLKKPKVIWVDIEKNREKIISLADKIHDALEGVNIGHSEKEFKPHATLGRVKSYEQIKPLTNYLMNYNFEAIETSFNSVQLIQSTLTQKGPIYKTLTKIPLTERFGD